MLLGYRRVMTKVHVIDPSAPWVDFTCYEYEIKKVEDKEGKKGVGEVI
jgi:hypothetical protein